MDPSTPTPLAFDESAIDFAGRRLLRDGVEQPLEPKAFAVLALLAGTPGRVFTRDEILDAVWGHRSVTPGVLNRVMTLLRHALGEDAQAARYLHTVHGVGYRFDLPAPAPGTPPQAMQASGPEAPTVPVPPPTRRRASERRAIPRAMLWLLPLLAVLAFAGWKWWPRTPAAATATRPAVATRVPAMERSIAVLPFANASQDADQQFFSDGLSDGLIDALSKFDGLKVIGRLSSFRFRDGKDDSKAIGAKLGAAWLLSGRVQRSGDVVRIGRSHAQREIVEDTFIVALIRSGELPRARALLDRRLHRRPSPRDAIATRKLAVLVADGSDLSALDAVREPLTSEGALLQLVGVRDGAITPLRKPATVNAATSNTCGSVVTAIISTISALTPKQTAATWP